MRTAYLAVVASLLAAAGAGAVEPEPPSRPSKQLLLELTLPHVGLPPEGKVKLADVRGTITRQYRAEAKADSPVRKAVRTAQVTLWVCSAENAPGPLQEEVAAMRKKARIDPAALRLRFAIPANRPAEQRLKAEATEHCREMSRFFTLIEDALEALDAVADQAEKEGPRWQAHVALLKLWLHQRLISLEEHQGALASMRKGLPEYDPNKHAAWQLVPAERVRDFVSKKHARQAASLAQQLKKAHKGTPWDKLAQEALKAKLGAEWQAVK